MEVTLISVIVGCVFLLGASRYLGPKEELRDYQNNSQDSQIESLKAELEAYSGIGKQLKDLADDNKKVWDTLDHVQNLAENGENFMKANHAEIENLKQTTSKIKHLGQNQLEQVREQMKKFKPPQLPQPLLIKENHEDMVLVEIYKRRTKDRSKMIKFSRWIPYEEYKNKYKPKFKKSAIQPAVAQQ